MVNVRNNQDSTTLANVTTPIQTRRQKVVCNQVTSPSTPHRIELRNDSSEENIGRKAAADPLPPLHVPKARRRLKNVRAQNQPTLTEYFPVRRSVRRCKKTVLEEKQQLLEDAVRSGREDGLLVEYFSCKGRGIVAAKDFCKGDFVVEYSGDLIDPSEAKEREKYYARDQNIGCYMYYFKFNSQQYCIDATAETGRLGRLVNHSRNGNLVTRTISIDNIPRLVLIAKDDIRKGEEVLYDYGDRSKESLIHHPWLAN